MQLALFYLALLQYADMRTLNRNQGLPTVFHSFDGIYDQNPANKYNIHDKLNGCQRSQNPPRI